MNDWKEELFAQIEEHPNSDIIVEVRGDFIADEETRVTIYDVGYDSMNDVIVLKIS